MSDWYVNFSKFCSSKVRNVFKDGTIKEWLERCVELGLPVKFHTMYTYDNGIRVEVPTFSVGLPVCADIYCKKEV